MNKKLNLQSNLKNLLLSLGIVSLATVGGGEVLAQATGTGSVVISLPNGTVQSVSGQMGLPNGFFYKGDQDIDKSPPRYGEYLIKPNYGSLNNATAPNDKKINELQIQGGAISSIGVFDRQAADDLRAGNLSDAVSLIRAYKPNSGSSDYIQATATGNATVVAPDGTTYAVSGEMALPQGLYYDFGAAGKLLVTPTIDTSNNAPNTISVEDLTVDPGSVYTAAAPPFDFQSAASEVLRDYTDNNDLSGQVSLIRAGKESGLMDSSSQRPQARAMGSATISLMNGAVMSVSAEMTLPPGVYYADPSDDASLFIDPIYSGDSQLNTLQIDSLIVNPNDIKGDIVWEFNAAAAYALYAAVLASDLNAQVSIIRAGAGVDGLD